MSAYTLPPSQLDAMLREDLPYGDLTTHALGIAGKRGSMHFAARYEMVLCGSEEAANMALAQRLHLTSPVAASGSHLAAGATIFSVSGDAADLHAVWKTAQTLMEYLSGIATATAGIVAAARLGNPAVSVACTRKNFPGTKAAAIKAILAGGATPHRLGLSETLLVFPEHRIFRPDEAPAATLALLRRQCPERKIVVEVCSEAEAAEWMNAGADVLQIEKLAPEAIARIVSATRALAHPPVVAAAGGINAGNAEAYARSGAAVLVTSAPYCAPPRDVAVSLNLIV